MVFVVDGAVCVVDGTVFAAGPPNLAPPFRCPRYVFAAFG